MMKQLSSYSYPCIQVFDELAESEDVYTQCAAPLVKAACSHGVATCFMYGQTGSGKTHTMSAIQAGVANDVFELAAGDPISLLYFELVGKHCHDLLDEARTELALKEGSDGYVHVVGAGELSVTTPEELMAGM